MVWRYAAALAVVPALAVACYAQEPKFPNWRTERVGQDVIFTPPDVPTGRVFSLTVRPAQDMKDRDLVKWLPTQAAADLKRFGTLVAAEKPTKSESGDLETFTMVQTARTPEGDQRFVVSLVSRRPTGQAVSAVIVANAEKELMDRYLRDALRIVLNAAKGDEEKPAPNPAKLTFRPAPVWERPGVVRRRV